MSETPIVSMLCKEPEGDIVRHIYPMDLSVDNLKKFWKLSSQFRYIFNEEVTKDFGKFCELIVAERDGQLASRGLFWVVDDFVGVFYMTQIQVGIDADVHYTFFDRRQKGRKELTRAMMQYVFERYKFQRITSEIPYYASWATRTFAESIGFVKEGRKRKAVLFNGEWFDVAIYGILQDEVLDGR